MSLTRRQLKPEQKKGALQAGYPADNEVRARQTISIFAIETSSRKLAVRISQRARGCLFYLHFARRPSTGENHVMLRRITANQFCR